MMQTRRPGRSRLLTTMIPAALATALAMPSFAQQRQQQPRGGTANRAAPAPAAPSPAPSGGGLNTLSDDALISELAGRGQESLLDRAFEVNKTPQEQRAGLRAFGALRELTNKQKPPTPARRQALIAQLAAGARAVLPTMKDPVKLMETAVLLLTEGAMRDVNLLEYWGENPATQARLRPVMETVVAMYDQAAAEAEAARADVEKRMTNPNDKAAADRWMKLEELATQAKFNRHMADYYLALAQPAGDAGQAQRTKIADTAAEFLKEFDAEDSGVQPAVRNRVGKLQLAKRDYPTAKATFDSVIAGKGLTPAPSPEQQYEARYFSVVADLESGNAEAARKGLAELLKWQQQALPNTPDVQKGVAAAAEMMQYRIHMADAGRFKSSGRQDEARKAEEAAVAVLTKLSNDRPDLRPIISEQLIERVGITQDVKGMDPLLLRALIQKGISERARPEGEQVNQQVLARAVDAAEELVRRKGNPGVDDTLAESAALLVPSFLERMGRKVEAANRYLDFIKAYPRSPQLRSAFESAGTLIATDLRRGPDRGKAEVVGVWKRFLPIAIAPPFNYMGFAYDYADRLRLDKQYREAAEFYAKVPATDPRQQSAKYFQMVSLFSQLYETKNEGGKTVPVVTGEARRQLAAEVLRLADEARKAAADAMSRAKDDNERARHQLKVAGAALTTAEVAAAEQNDPQKTLAALASFEQDVKGLPGSQDMLNRALYLRVGSLMTAGRFDDATAALVALQSQTGGQQGQEIVFDLLNRLDEDFDKAEAAGDTAKMLTLSQNRAKLSGFLVQRARSSTNAELRNRVYSYSVYDAESKRRAGTLAKDEKQLREALAAFRALQTPEMAAMYRQEASGNPKIDPNYPHPNVLLGIGLTGFELGDYKAAQENLGRLLVDKKLGGPELPKVDEKTGEQYYVDNAPYWEATYKLLRSNVELFKQNRNDAAAQEAYENSKSHLKRLYVRGNVGGEKWKDEFEALRKEIVPDFDPKSVALTTPPGDQDRPAAARGGPTSR